MASVNLAPPAQRDWILANPWPWMGAGLAICLWSWAWACAFGAQASDNRVLLLPLGLAAAGVAVALRLNETRPPYLARFSPVWQRLFVLGLGGLFGLLSLALTGVVTISLLGLPSSPVYPGLAFVLWFLLAPVSTAAALRCLRRVRHREGVAVTDEKAALLWLASLCALTGAQALDLRPALADDWDSIRFFLRSAALAILIGAALVACSSRARRLEISALILFHFSGIAVATMAAPPSSWIVTQLWIRIYRPYLEFMYLNNAYHFYAPEPGPASYVWLRLIYADPHGQEVGVWHKVPRVDENGQLQHTVALEYQRHLALTEGTVPTDPPTPALVINKEGQPDLAPFFKRRLGAVPGTITVIGVEKPPLAIPFDPQVAQAQQYMAPSRTTRFLLEAFARHAASLPHPEDAKHPDRPPQYRFLRSKIYRAIHTIPGSAQLAAGVDALRDPTLFRPYFMGEYDSEGKLLEPNDPFLYWLLPVLRASQGNKIMISNYAAQHAGDPAWKWEVPNQAGKQ